MTLNGRISQYFRRVTLLTHNAKLYLVATSLQGFSNGIWGVIFYLYLNLHEIGFDLDFIGGMAFAGTIATGIVALPAGLLIERIGPKRGILIGLTANFVNIIMILAIEPNFLVVAAFVSGLIGTISWVAGAPFMMENSRQEERTYLFSFDWAVLIVMGVAGSFVGGVLPDILNGLMGLPLGAAGSAVGYRLTLAISIALALCAAFPILLIADKERRQSSVGEPLIFRGIKNPKTIIKFMIPAAIIGFGAGFIVPLFNVFFKERFAATAEQVGIMSAASNITLGIGTLAAPEVSKRLGKVKSVALFEYLSMPFIMLTTLSPNLTFAASSYVTRNALMNMAGPIGTTLQMEQVADTERAITNGCMVMSDNIPRAVTASISGGMMTGNDFVTPFLFTTITYAIASTIYVAFFRKVEKTKRPAIFTG